MANYNRELDKITQFDTCKNEICYKIVGSEQNQDMLKNVPNMPVIDGLTAVFYIRLSDCETVTISNDLIRLWNIPKESAVPVLYQHAAENTERLKPVELISMPELTKDSHEGKRNNADEAYVLTTTDTLFGASTILYQNGQLLTDALQKMSRQTGHNINAVYILPSSIHEVLIVPDTGYYSSELLQAMVQSMNRSSYVKPEEILSDQIYHYDCQNGLKTVDTLRRQRTQDISR